MTKKKSNPKRKLPKGRKKIISKKKTTSFWKNKQMMFPIIGILLFTIACFWTSIDNDFVYWDDDRNIMENPLVSTFSSSNFWANTKDIFTTDVIGNYNPLSIFTFGLENMFFGIDQPIYWHLDNLVLHLICVFFVYRIGILFGLNVWGASLMTLLFAIHPMRVESVAWITERKDVLFGSFFLAAMYQYLKYKKYGGRKRIWFMSILFVLSLFSKIQAVTFPIVMMLIDYYFDKKITLKTVTSKWPYLLMSLAMGILGIAVLGEQGSLATNDTFPFWQRLFIGSFSFMIYLVKLVIPFQLSPLYPYPPSIPSYFYPSMIIAPLYLYLIYWAWKKENKVLVFGLLFFLINVVLLLQVLGAGQGFLADRFTYIPYLGLFFILAFYFQKYIAQPSKSMLIKGIGAIAIVAFGFMTFNQNKVWKNSDTLWSHVLKYYKNSTLPYGNRANYRRDNGNYRMALADYNKALSIKSDQSSTLNSRAKLFFTMARTNDTLMLALNDYNKAIELDPNNGEYIINQGATLARLGRLNEALEAFNRGLQIKPDHISGYGNRSIIYSQLGNPQAALADIETYLRYRPYSADYWFESGSLKARLGRPAEGIADIDQAIRYNNRKGVFYYRKAEILMTLNRIPEGRVALQNAINLGYTNISQELRSRLGQ